LDILIFFHSALLPTIELQVEGSRRYDEHVEEENEDKEKEKKKLDSDSALLHTISFKIHASFLTNRSNN